MKSKGKQCGAWKGKCLHSQPCFISSISDFSPATQLSACLVLGKWETINIKQTTRLLTAGA